MEQLTGNRVASLTYDVVSRIALKHAALNAVVGHEPVDQAHADGLIAEIWQLAEDFNCAVYVEHTLGRIRDQARYGALEPRR